MIPVELNDVWASYGTGRQKRSDPKLTPQTSDETLAGIELCLRAGELCAVLGPNGAGKSTLLRVIAGLLPPSRGQVQIFGRDAASMGRQELSRKVGVVTQRNEVALGFTVRQVVALGRAPHQGSMLRSCSDDERIVRQAMQICELGKLEDRPVDQLSGGEQKRVHIARALAQQTPILLLDEAAAHLDIRHSIALYELIRAEVTNKQLACLAVMHDLNAAAQHADRVILLKDGRVIADGSVEQVMTAEQLMNTFEAEIHVGISDRAAKRYFMPVAVVDREPAEPRTRASERAGE